MSDQDDSSKDLPAADPGPALPESGGIVDDWSDIPPTPIDAFHMTEGRDRGRFGELDEL